MGYEVQISFFFFYSLMCAYRTQSSHQTTPPNTHMHADLLIEAPQVTAGAAGPMRATLSNIVPPPRNTQGSPAN